jgi:hypothetical protein
VYYRPGFTVLIMADGENMRRRQRLIDINPLLSICLISLSDNAVEVRTSSAPHYLPLRDLNIMMDFEVIP